MYQFLMLAHGNINCQRFLSHHELREGLTAAVATLVSDAAMINVQGKILLELVVLILLSDYTCSQATATGNAHYNLINLTIKKGD